ncbi:ABC transporter permease [Clostridium formicaceticum]|uniref:Glutathione transport system permease protein GsiD n=2 Tax=Clostridium formicaceticum TaxID=1497 RepID=A0AAC9RN23_9CLOT|nr:ABC transporter permease [Clostridium formicaceticum]ARE88225.1 Glutathione transport system permease protein GsiD [Clostridium formicaceticum]
MLTNKKSNLAIEEKGVWARPLNKVKISINIKENKIWILSLLLGAILMVTILSPFLFTQWNEIDFSRQMQPPSLQHPFGTDNFGRDLLQRVFHGLRISLTLAVAIEALSFLIGLSIGLVLGYYGGIVDEFFIHVMNILMAFPQMLMALCFMAIMGSSMTTLVIVITSLGWISYARIVRSEVLSLKQRDFILSTKAIGASDFYILIKHILPNVLIPVIPLMTLMIGHAVLIIAGLSFLGFGVQPPYPEIGLMLNEAMTFMDSGPWLMLFPGLILATCVFLFNTLGDLLRDYLAPKIEDTID